MNTQSILDKIQNGQGFFERLVSDPLSTLQDEDVLVGEIALQALRSLEAEVVEDPLADVNYIC